VLNDSINEIKAIIKAPYQGLLPPTLASNTPRPLQPSSRASALCISTSSPASAATSTLLQYSADGTSQNIQEEIPSHEARTLKLGNNTIISFTPDDVPLPPAPTFAHDLPRLNRMWDDTSTYWDGQSALRIKGIPIAIIYWPIIYASSKVDGPWKSGHWNILKSRHSEWKVRHMHYSLFFTLSDDPKNTVHC
jgi:hypothetical protein